MDSSSRVHAKRARAGGALTAEDLMHHAQLIMENDPFKIRAPQEEERSFRALFGCGPKIAFILWERLTTNTPNGRLLPEDAEMKHLLWSLMYCKQYGKWKTMRKLTKTDPKTLRKWIFLFYDAIAFLEPFVIRWSNRYKGDKQNDCLVSVDGTDFQIPYHGRRFHSHKYKFGSALRYEVAICILTGELVWINGPYEPGTWNDVSIFRDSLKSMLDAGERVEADDGYRGESPGYVKCPQSIGNYVITEAMAAIVRRRHETVNKRFKQWGILKQVYRSDLSKHHQVFRVVAIVTQLAIENGEPLFALDYEDPDFDNLYFADQHLDDDDDEEEDDNVTL